MSHSTENSAWKLSPQQESEVAKMNSVSEIQMAMEKFAREQGLYGGDPMDATMRIEQPRPNIPANTPMARVINVNGIKHYIQGATEEELVKNELAVMREIFAEAPAAEAEPPRNDRGQFVPRADADPAAAALAPSVVAALEAAGIDPDALREYSESKSGERAMQSWESAAEEFRNSPVGSSYPGGEQNKFVMGKVIQELNLTDQPSVETLQKAYEYMQRHNLVSVNPELQRLDKIKTANTYEDLKRAAGYQGDGGSGFFGH